MHGPALPQVGASIRDPFAWKEALTPGVSPVVSARNSRAGSRAGGSNQSTPRNDTPPLSPAFASGSALGSARSDRSNLSGRSNGSARSGYTPTPAEAFVCGGYPANGAFPELSARSSNNFYTPQPSARSSEFTSVYDASSAAPSARNAEFGTLYENGLTLSPPIVQRQEGGEKRRHKAMAAALDAFLPSPSSDRPTTGSTRDESGPSPSAADSSVEVSLDPRQVYSSCRHGRHKEVEACLVAGFDPNFQDSFGNTLFHVSCQNGNKRIAKLAIKYGGDMDAQNVKGHTGLHFLFSYGYPDIAEYFIEKGADDSIQNDFGKTPEEGIR
ncbi:unnamed protein product [Polarella glacialis]|uniref:Ankyrin repeat-containing protein n=2 Tax=Polarella glacialis TaxID=89957 RepID=A0A813HV62_POLGL|nr:unnamed protein product [Polarella glacialis]CAE8642242.1 unnamed protein product [Polarella glacialis]|mmetsp:Transcript_7639/g.12138  ORF Transcript_7639/g.12138 Transcript_7639/m.12138 type:complete len:327 (-) Transcript_7639:21-1001(-)